MSAVKRCSCLWSTRRALACAPTQDKLSAHPVFCLITQISADYRIVGSQRSRTLWSSVPCSTTLLLPFHLSGWAGCGFAHAALQYTLTAPFPIGQAGIPMGMSSRLRSFRKVNHVSCYFSSVSSSVAWRIEPKKAASVSRSCFS